MIDKGVPQGSALGPLLFSIFINDLPQICSDCSIQLYADDTNILFQFWHFTNPTFFTNGHQLKLKRILLIHSYWSGANMLVYI